MHLEEVFYEVEENFRVPYIKGRGYIDIVNSHTVLGIFSMQMIVGYLCGRKVVTIQPKSLKVDPSPLSRWGLVPILKNVDEVVEFFARKNIKTKNFKFKKQLKDRFDQLGISGSVERFQKFLIKYSN